MLKPGLGRALQCKLCNCFILCLDSGLVLLFCVPWDYCFCVCPCVMLLQFFLDHNLCVIVRSVMFFSFYFLFILPFLISPSASFSAFFQAAFLSHLSPAPNQLRCLPDLISLALCGQPRSISTSADRCLGYHPSCILILHNSFFLCLRKKYFSLSLRFFVSAHIWAHTYHLTVTKVLILYI